MLMLDNTADCYHTGMIGIKEIRRLKLIEMLKGYESIEQFCKNPIAIALNITAGYVVQLKNGTSKIGDSTAEKLEKIGGKPPFWLGQSYGVCEPPAEYQGRETAPLGWTDRDFRIISKVHEMSPEDQSRYEDMGRILVPTPGPKKPQDGQ